MSVAGAAGTFAVCGHSLKLLATEGFGIGDRKWLKPNPQYFELPLLFAIIRSQATLCAS
jgi:hypothetical protein